MKIYLILCTLFNWLFLAAELRALCCTVSVHSLSLQIFFVCFSFFLLQSFSFVLFAGIYLYA